MGPLVTVLMEFHCTFQIPPEPTKELSGVADLTYVAGIVRGRRLGREGKGHLL